MHYNNAEKHNDKNSEEKKSLICPVYPDLH